MCKSNKNSGTQTSEKIVDVKNDGVMASESGGFHIFELHLPTVGTGLGFLLLLGLGVLVTVWAYRKFRHAQRRRSVRMAQRRRQIEMISSPLASVDASRWGDDMVHDLLDLRRRPNSRIHRQRLHIRKDRQELCPTPGRNRPKYVNLYST